MHQQHVGGAGQLRHGRGRASAEEAHPVAQPGRLGAGLQRLALGAVAGEGPHHVGLAAGGGVDDRLQPLPRSEVPAKSTTNRPSTPRRSGCRRPAGGVGDHGVVVGDPVGRHHHLSGIGAPGERGLRYPSVGTTIGAGVGARLEPPHGGDPRRPSRSSPASSPKSGQRSCTSSTTAVEARTVGRHAGPARGRRTPRWAAGPTRTRHRASTHGCRRTAARPACWRSSRPGPAPIARGRAPRTCG